MRNLDRWLARAAKLRTIVSTPSYRRALRHGVAAATEHHHAPLPTDIRTVLDVGANRGQFALVAAERWPNARLICFEPLPRPLATLRRVLRHRPGSEIVHAAVSRTPGEAMMHVSRADDSSSLLPITDRQARVFPHTEEVGVLKVRTTSLEESVGADIERPVLLKIDVQGSELDVLRGAGRLLEAVDVVIVECSLQRFYADQPLAEQVIRFLHTRGFAIAGAVAPTVDRRNVLLQLDLIFRRAADPRLAFPSLTR